MMNPNIAEQFATMLLRVNPEPEFDVTFPGEDKTVQAVVRALEKRGCLVNHDHMQLHVVRASVSTH